MPINSVDTLVLLDEPTNHLDIGFQYQIMSILKKQNLTVFSSVHDLNIAACYCDKIVLMKAGKIVAVGTPEEMFTPELILKLFGVHTQVTVNAVTGRPNIVFIPSEEITGNSTMVSFNYRGGILP